MEIAKIIHDNIIYKITEDEFHELILKYENKQFTCEDKKLFLLKKETSYIAIDNTSGDLYTEDFKTLSAALIYLYGLQEAEPLKAAENTDFWY